MFFEGDLIRVDVQLKDLQNLRKPAGTEVGANSKFVEGGKTIGGVTEGVVDNLEKAKATTTVVKDL